MGKLIPNSNSEPDDGGYVTKQSGAKSSWIGLYDFTLEKKTGLPVPRSPFDMLRINPGLTKAKKKTPRLRKEQQYV